MSVKDNKVLKSGIWYIISNILIRGIGIITSPIYTRMLTPAQKGLADNFNSWVSIFTTVTCLCLIYSVGRAKLDFPDNFDEYMSSIQALSSGFGMLVLIGAVCNLDRLSGMLGYQKAEVVLLFVYLIIYPSLDYLQYKYRFEYKYKENIVISIVICISTVLMSIGLMVVMEDRAFAKILGTVLPGMLVGLWCYLNLFVKGKTIYNKVYWKYALMIGLPMIPHGLALVILNKIDSVMIQKLCAKELLGIYTTGYSIAVLLSVITNAIGQAWLPWFNEQLYENKKDTIRKKNMLLMELGCFLTIGFIVVGPEVIMILCGEKFWDAKWVIPPVAIATLCQYFYTNYVNVELFYKKTVLIAVNSIAAALINVGLNAYFIPRFGYLAAAYTTLAGYFILMILHYVATRFLLKEQIYHDFTYFVMLILTGAVGIGFLYLYPYWVIRYGAAIILCGFLAFVKRNDIIDVIEFLKSRKTKE